MSDSSNRWTIMLLCLNAVLLTAVVASSVSESQAYAQSASAGQEYVLVPGGSNRSSDKQVVWIVNLTHGQLTNCIYDRNRNYIQFGDIIDMTDDFFREEFFDEQPEFPTSEGIPPAGANPGSTRRRNRRP